jgi:hypothetical protein
MAPEAGPSLSLTVQPSRGKGRTAYTSTALGLAAAFHREFSCCTNDPQRRKVCQNYRDKILSICEFADLTAAAFHDAFPQFLREFSRGEDATAWTSFASLVQRQRKSRNRGAQLLQLQTTVVAIWGKDVFTHYGWCELPLDSTKLLHGVASKLPDWNFAVKVINDALIERHERRVVKLDNRAQRIGEHSRGSKIQDRHSPVEPRDLEIILSRVKDGKLQTSSQGEHKKPTYTIDGTPIREHGLKRDRFSMIVPDGAPGVVRKSSSPSRQANKRRRMDRNDYESLAEPEELQSPTPGHQSAPTSAYMTDSEMTELVEEDPSGSLNADIGSDAQTHADEDEMRSNTDETESLTPEPSVRESRNSSTQSSLQSTRASRDTASNSSVPPTQTNCSPVETRTERDAGGTHMYVTDFQSTPIRGPAESSDQGSSPRSGGETFDTEVLEESPQESSASLATESDHLSSDVVDRPCEVINASKDCHTRPLHEQELAALQPIDVTVPDQQRDVPNEEIQTGNESEAEFTSPDDIAALETIALMGEQSEPLLPKACSSQGQGLQPTPPHESMSESVTLDSEAFSYPTTNGRFIPATTERSKERYCTNTDVEDNGTIVGRMASRHASRLREILDTARKHHDDHNMKEHNELKVEWLEKTQWANVYAAPNDLDPTCQLPLDADVWYMDWETFQRRADGGEVFRKPIIVKQVFQDSGMYDPDGYMALLRERYPNQKLDMQNSETGECVSKSITDLLATRAESEGIGPDTLESTESSNAINLRRIANADAPLLIRMKRFRLLETLVDRVSNLAPGKRTCREAYDISDCLGFNLLGFSGAFSRPHVDSLVGTWIRCLSGSKAWIFAPRMSDKDWDDFAQDGAKWSPGDKGRIVILEKDDVLLMPPGLRVLHTVFTIETSLMEGGMLWDENNIPQLLDELLWVGQNQSCTNEAIAYQLPSIIDSLEIWIHENGARISAIGKDSDYITSVKQGIRNLRSLGCKCSHRCDKNSSCHCSTEKRRCTGWCSKHPAFPGRAAGQARQCMLE